MSSQLTLLDMPDDEMRKILEHCNFRSILTLRKTCHDLRNFIDDVRPDKKLTKIFVILEKSKSIKLSVENQLEFGTFHIKYESYQSGCLLTTHGTAHLFKPENQTKKLLKDQNHVDIFMKDLEIILKFQKKSVLNQFFMSFDVEDTIGFMEKMESFLKIHRKNWPIKTKIFDFRSLTQHEILQVLPYFDPESIQEIYISYREPGTLSEELLATEQWKKATKTEVLKQTRWRL